jgi:excisionase family DNA binding protein
MVTVSIDGLEETIRQVLREEIAAIGAPDEWLDSTEAAEYLGISRGHLHNLRATVPSHKVGGRRRYRRSELDAYQEGGRA